MNLIIDCETATIEPGGSKCVRVTLDKAEKDDVLNSIELDDAIRHFGQDEILEHIGFDEIKDYIEKNS